VLSPLSGSEPFHNRLYDTSHIGVLQPSSFGVLYNLGTDKNFFQLLGVSQDDVRYIVNVRVSIAQHVRGKQDTCELEHAF
jgi:hypothetical protein